MAPPFDGNFVQTRSLRFHFRQTGVGRPLLMIHGFPQTSAEWAPLMAQLGGERFACFAPDTRGFGRSDKPRIRVTLDLLVRDTIDFMDALGIERAVLVGHDFGGMIAVAAALDHPDRFSRVAVLDSTATVWIPWASHGYWFKVPGLPEEFFERHHEGFLEAIFRGGPSDLPGAPSGPFPAARSAPKQSWCDPDALAEYLASYRDPDSQWAAISYYRDALPFHRERAGRFEYVQPREIEEMWFTEGGYAAHPAFGEYYCYSPERASLTYEGPALYLYTATMHRPPPPGGELGSGLDAANPHAAYAAFLRHFPALRSMPMDCGHFIPEVATGALAEVLAGFSAG